MIKTYSFRIKGLKSKKLLCKQAKSVNFVWNFCNDIQKKAVQQGRQWPSYFDLAKLTTGSSKELGIVSRTIVATCKQYTESRNGSHRRKLRYRGKKSLGWVPFVNRRIKVCDNYIVVMRNKFNFWNSGISLEDAKVLCGSNFSQDSRGNWYLNLVVDVSVDPSNGQSEVGIDLGLKDFATLSNGEKIKSMQFYRSQESKLAMAQRANKKNQVKAIHAKIKNKRKDFHHKLSTKLIEDSSLIFVGDVSSSKLAKTNMAKSIYDSAWSQFKTFLKYKAIAHNVKYLEVNESYTTVTCSECLNRTGPRGLGGLEVREWACSECGTVHDRDVNAAKNILRLGYQSLNGATVECRGIKRSCYE